MLGNAEAAISKQVAMAEQMTRKAEAAVKRMNTQKPTSHQPNNFQGGGNKGANKRIQQQNWNRKGQGKGAQQNRYQGSNKWTRKGGKGWA